MNQTSRAPARSSLRAPPRAIRSRVAVFWLKAFVREVINSRTTGMAAEMAFWLFLSLIPLGAVAGLVAAKIAANSADVATMLDSLPPETRHMVSRQLSHVAAWKGGAVGAPAIVVFFWLASGGIHSVFQLLEVKAGVSRSWWKKRIIALFACLGLSIGTAMIAVLAGGLRRILAFLHGVVWSPALEREAGIFDSAVRSTLGMVTAVGLVAGLYYIGIPRSARRHVPVVPGALLAVGLQVMLGYGYVFYLSKVGIQSAYQAGLSIIGVTMIALYLASFALLVGAALNSMLGKTT
jgi:membrane protein